MGRKNTTYKVTSTLKQYPSERATWYVVTLDAKTGKNIYEQFGSQQGGFGSLRVSVTLGASTWQTSIFRDSSAKSYILFIKAAVRKQEQVRVGDKLAFTLTLLPT